MTVRRYVALLASLMALLVLVEARRERPLDLRVRLERQGRAPFDAEVFYHALPAWLGQPVEPVAEPPFDRLADSTVTGRTYLFLNQDVVPGEAAAERLLAFVARGNTVVVAAHDLRGPLFDSLAAVPPGSRSPGVRTETAGDGMDLGLLGPVGTLGADSLSLVSPGVDRVYRLPVGVQRWHLVGLDPARTEVLGRGADSTRVTLARIRHGRGTVLVCSTPLVFSNAALTGDGDAPAYVGALLAALPRQPVWWDDHHKAYRGYAQTPLRVVLATPALRWAYGLLLVAGLLYLAFRARRWQRPIPVVAPPPNAQREFARTVGRLHFVHRDDARLARRQARHLLDRVRTDLGLADPDLSPETARRVAPRAGVPEDEALALWATVARVSREPRPDPETLIRLDARIARFFRHAESPAATP